MSNSSDPPKIKKVLVYDIEWMDDTFTSKSVIQSLLSTEREAGNISTHDYDATVKFFSNYHRRYPIIGALAAASLTPLLNNPKWVRVKQLGLTFALGLSGNMAGKLYSGVSHLRYVQSLDNPHGFQKAMNNIQTQMALPKGHRLSLRWPYEVSPDDLDPDENNGTTSNLILDINSEKEQTKATVPPKSIWDEIRSANNSTARNSTWDTIRQHHERQGTKARPKESPEDESVWIDNPSGQMERYANPETYDAEDKYSRRDVPESS